MAAPRPSAVIDTRVIYCGTKNRMTRYAIIVEKGPTSYGAYVPDLPGCVAAAETRMAY